MLDVNTANPVDVESLRMSINGFAKEMRSQAVRDDHLWATQAGQLPEKKPAKGEKKHCPPCDLHTTALKAMCLHHVCKTVLESRTGRQRLTKQPAKTAINEASLLFAHSMGVASAMRYAATERISTFDIVLPTNNPEVFVPLAAALFVPAGAANSVGLLGARRPGGLARAHRQGPLQGVCPVQQAQAVHSHRLGAPAHAQGQQGGVPGGVLPREVLLFHVAMVCARDCPECKVNLFGFVVQQYLVP